ncbi:Pentatricopeptide repeat-containing protein [Actinidia chinensis var. chinensis]|uniref:Pentatricopeptide repeat-containing protein n=1 Tax=Actinidia chinensis var. chinensis TaxID=1590841 RepID=A0A2R6PWF8_ACTCC|nr:Pentatricopeptide repeat-containing protein [Actinidia chinensis var. chinensis]
MSPPPHHPPPHKPLLLLHTFLNYPNSRKPKTLHSQEMHSSATNVCIQVEAQANPNIFPWNTVIRGYVESENLSPAIDLTLVDVYVSCGHTDSAHKLFELIPDINLVIWNSVINGFAINGRLNEALILYREMSLDGVKPDGFTMELCGCKVPPHINPCPCRGIRILTVSFLTTCAELGALALGKRTHVYMVKVGLSENVHATNAFLDLYAKCGSIREAKKVFDEMGEISVLSWKCLVVGLVVNGFRNKALELFKYLKRERAIGAH